MTQTRRSRRSRLALWALLGLSSATSVLAQEGSGPYGRVRITVEPDTRFAAVTEALEARYATPAGQVRIISVRRREDDANRYVATIYDYSREKAYDLFLDAKGRETGRIELGEQPPVTRGEIDDAAALLARGSQWSDGIKSGTLQVYESMPPILTDENGRRLVNIGVMARPVGSWDATENEIVSVHLPTGDVLHHAAGAPETAVAPLLVCGPGSQGCGANAGTCTSTYHFEWPAGNPVWKFDAMHPSCTSSIQSQGTGLELQNVKYRDKLILKRAGMPVLNVKYDNDACGPYRDWLTSESCFTASGTPVGSTGFIVGSGTPLPATFCEQGTDNGNFLGVSIHDEGDTLWLLTETSAGWYRYVMEWKLGLDGTIEPIVGFGATSNGCTCNTHHHHAYWRFEWALDGNENDPSTGINILERKTPSSQDWVAITQESAIVRDADFTKDWLRVRNPQTGSFYVLYPGTIDGSAQGDGYAKADSWALAYNAGEIDDPNGDTSINLAPWMNGEAIGGSKRLVLWYRTGYLHDFNGGDIEPCELAGPKLAFRQPCQGLITLTQGVVGCNSALPIQLDDSDLANAGTQAVTVRSTTEPTGEIATLVESPAGSGHFTGSISTTSAPAAANGVLSVANADTITIDYVDSSSCGTPNVNITQSASVDCLAPAISNVQVTAITDSSATVTWTTNEPANSGTLYGPTQPPGSSAQDLATYSVTHSLNLTGLAACAAEYFQVSSADPAGNVAVDTNGGAYYRFDAGGRGFRLGPDNVEAGNGSWTPTGTAGTAWHTDTCKSSSPTHAWKAGSATCPGSYGNNADTYLTSAPLNLGAAGHGYHLHFKEQYGTQSGSDFCRVQVSTDNGANWALVAEYSGSSPVWTAKDYDLSPYGGSGVLLRFWFHSNGTTTAEGWYLDDLDISRTAPCGASLTRSAHAAADACASGASNGVTDPGDDVAVQVTAKNAGLVGATHVSATLTTSTPGIVVTRAAATFADMAPDGGTAVSNAPGFAFTVGTGVPCGTLVDFVLHFEADQGSWTDSFQVRVGTGGTGVHPYAAADTPRAIPDNSIVTSSIAVVNPGTVSNVKVTMNVTHTYDNDLTLTLIGPNGTRVLLSNRNGSSGDNFTNTTFDDGAAAAITEGEPPYAGSFRPQAPLSGLNGIAGSGTWTLEVNDQATADTGTINSWSVTLTTSDAFTCSNCGLTAPSEVPALAWSPASLVAIDWSTLPAASWYDLHRGTGADLTALLTGAVDSCLRYRGTTAGTGPILTELPPAGSFYWFLVTASNGAGTGGAGSASSGPRMPNATGACP